MLQSDFQHWQLHSCFIVFTFFQHYTTALRLRMPVPEIWITSLTRCMSNNKGISNFYFDIWMACLTSSCPPARTSGRQHLSCFKDVCVKRPHEHRSLGSINLQDCGQVLECFGPDIAARRTKKRKIKRSCFPRPSMN